MASEIAAESELVESLYDAAMGYRSWDEVGRHVIGHMASTTLMMSVLNPRSAAVDIVSTQGLTSQNLQDYLQFAHDDPWLSRVTAQGLFGRAVIGSQIIEERDLLRTTMYNEFLRPRTNVHHLNGSVVPLDGGQVAIIGTHRPRDAPDFSIEDARKLSRVLPHLRRSLEVRRRLLAADREASATRFVLDRLSLGVILIAATGRLLHVNRAGEAILRDADGLSRTHDGLRAGHKEDDRRLQLMISELRQPVVGGSRSAGGHIRVRRPSGRPAYAVMLSPVARGIVADGKCSPAVLALVSDPGGKMVSDLAILGAQFDFTAAEARVVLGLIAGKPLPGIAQETGVSYSTVRTLLARAMARTETHSQVELVLLVARTLVGIAPFPDAESTASAPVE